MIIDEVKKLIDKFWIEENEMSSNSPLSETVYYQLVNKLKPLYGEYIGTLILDGLIMEKIERLENGY